MKAVLCSPAPDELVTLTYQDANLPYDGQPYQVSSTCRVDGHETSRAFTVFDSVGHCATQTVAPIPRRRCISKKTVTPANVQPGDWITYTLDFANWGSVLLTGVSLADTIPVSVTVSQVISSGMAITQTTPGYVWAVQDLAPSDTGIITITGQVTNASAGTTFTNTVTIAATEGDEAQSAVAIPVGGAYEQACGLLTGNPMLSSRRVRPSPSRLARRVTWIA
jgi:uncharacterized repeat protein (TIGR01451 family)